MRLPSSLTRILGAVIVMIAVYALPSAALAHQGHDQVSSASSIAAAEITASVEDAAVVEAQPSERSAQVSRAPADKRPCNAVCCTGGSSCCAPAIGNSSACFGSPQRVRTLVLAPAAVFGGVDPNLFRRPPRSFA